jgi:anti-sigma factor RsiW
MRCQEFREMMDSYLGDELLVETNHDVLRHLENCPACRNELAARRGLLAQMRSAVKNAPEMQLNQAFAIKLRNNLRETALRPSVWEKLKSGSFSGSRLLAATAACLLLMTLFGVVWFNQSSPAENIAAVGENQTNKPDDLSRPTESPVTQARSNRVAGIDAFGNRRPQKLRSSFSAGGRADNFEESRRKIREIQQRFGQNRGCVFE